MASRHATLQHSGAPANPKLLLTHCDAPVYPSAPTRYGAHAMWRPSAAVPGYCLPIDASQKRRRALFT